MLEERQVGFGALIDRLGVVCPEPAVSSVVGPGARHTTRSKGLHVEKYPLAYAPDDTIFGNLKFALRYEPIDVGILVRVMRAIDPRDVTSWILSEPTGAYARRIWFFYEWATSTTLDIKDAQTVSYVPALDEKLNFTSKGKKSPRHKVIDNLLGDVTYCPTVRKTPELIEFMTKDLSRLARNLLGQYDKQTLTRAINYLFTKETRKTFEIENETATPGRAERFIAALRTTRNFNPTKLQDLIALQNIIVDQRYAATGLRDFQNFVGETVAGYREVVHFVCPKPSDLPTLMDGWFRMIVRNHAATDPVVNAALTAFGFVFLHPFDDGNGRVHRFLIHHILSQEGMTPDDMIFPVSAAFLRKRVDYDRALESFSRPISRFINWTWTPEKNIQVHNDTSDLYRYFDATEIVEFLYACIEDTITVDLKDELDFVEIYEASMRSLQKVVDMPNRRANLLVKICLQNGGRLSKAKREDFAELTDDEITRITEAFEAILAQAGSEQVVFPDDD